MNMATELRAMLEMLCGLGEIWTGTFILGSFSCFSFYLFVLVLNLFIIQVSEALLSENTGTQLIGMELVLLNTVSTLPIGHITRRFNCSYLIRSEECN